MVRRIVLSFFSFLILLNSSHGWAAGHTHHAYMGARAADLYVQDPILKKLLADMRQDLIDGEALPDGGYGGTGNYPDIAETFHWTPFQEGYFKLIMERCDPRYASRWSQECRINVAYFMGMTAHGVQDEIYDPLFRDRTGLINGTSISDMDGDLLILRAESRPMPSAGNQRAFDWIDTVTKRYISPSISNVNNTTLTTIQSLMVAAAVGERQLVTWNNTLDSLGMTPDLWKSGTQSWFKKSWKYGHGGTDHLAKICAKVWTYYWKRLNRIDPGPASLSMIPDANEIIERDLNDPLGQISVFSDRPIRSNTLNASSLTISDANGRPVKGHFYYPKDRQMEYTHVILFVPDQPLSFSQKDRYQVTMSSSIRDVEGRALIGPGTTAVTWEILPDTQTYLTLRAPNGQYAAAEGGGFNVFTAKTTDLNRYAQFHLVSKGQNQFGLRSQWGSFAQAYDNGSMDFRSLDTRNRATPLTVIPQGGDQVMVLCGSTGKAALRAVNGGGGTIDCKGTPANSQDQQNLLFKMALVGPVIGGSGGNAFNDDNAIPFAGSVARVGLRSGDAIDAIEIEFEGGLVLRHGGNGGTLRQLTLNKNETLTDMKICRGPFDNVANVVRYIKIITSRGRKIEAGIPTGDCSSLLEAKESYQIAGFVGSSGAYLDRIGPIYVPVRYAGWGTGEPHGGTGSGHCAQMQIFTGSWSNNSCESYLRFACQSLSNPLNWTTSAAMGPWQRGISMCAPGYQFAVPKNAQQNTALWTAMRSAGATTVWLNFTDAMAPGKWSGLP